VVLYLVVAGIGALTSYLVTPGVRVLAVKVGALDIPKDRKVHHAPTPTMGGIGIYVGFLVAMLSVLAIGSLRPAFRFTEVFGLIFGGLGVLALGIADDRRDLQAPVKLAGQILAAGLLYLSGVQMNFFWLPGVGVLYLSPDLAAPLTILWVIVLINAVNLIDGLDGLAAGLTTIAAGAFLVYSFRLPPELLGPHPLAPLAAAALAGACLGFLRHNFNPARIFMGDSGSMLLGYLLAGATISAVGRSTIPGASEGRLALPLVLTPIVFLALPITDVAFAVVRRLATGRPIYHPDKEHIHHRLLRLGHSHRQAVLVMYGWALLLAAGALPWGRFLLLFAGAVGTVTLFTAAPRLREGNGNGNGDPAADEPPAFAAPHANR
jgi:UDP-GlcNAc:undecaprenyl-phosphate GlcNAc-1-phosphate transferase